MLAASLIIVAGLLAGCAGKNRACANLPHPEKVLSLGGDIASISPDYQSFSDQVQLIKRCQPAARYSRREWDTSIENIVTLKDGRTFLVFGFVHIADVKAIYQVNSEGEIEAAFIAGL